MSSVTLWSDRETGVSACWNKRSPFSQRPYSVATLTGVPKFYHTEVAAVRAAKRLAKKVSRGEGEQPAMTDKHSTPESAVAEASAISKGTEKARRKLLRLIGRKELEQMSNRDAPWHCDRETLELEILRTWPTDDIADAIESLLKRAQQ